MTTGDLIRRMVLAHATHDDAGFDSAVRDLIEEERRPAYLPPPIAAL